ncbi:MAG TPA: lipoprotein-releasing system ATP-binding protein LolD, partial [Marinilabiliales bacterium]|nr:lipoprotein-releasing system ATP-binding protein LolD [Marinilabiliales bacterium]
MIKVEKITKSFGELQVLKEIDLEVPAGKIYSIVGPSGAGKTTLLQIIGTLSLPASGKVFINGQNISVLNEHQLADFRNRQIG